MGPVDRGDKWQPFGRRAVEVPVAGMDDGLDQKNFRVGRESGKCRPDHGRTKNLSILLGDVSSCTQSTSGCYNHRCDLHRIVPPTPSQAAVNRA